MKHPNHEDFQIHCDCDLWEYARRGKNLHVYTRNVGHGLWRYELAIYRGSERRPVARNAYRTTTTRERRIREVESDSK